MIRLKKKKRQGRKLNQAKVNLLHNTPLWVAVDGVRTCWASGEKSDTKFYVETDMDSVLYQSQEGTRECHDNFEMGELDLALIDRVGNKFKHASTLEHLYYNFHITGISRALLQELSRHRITSPSVKSSRYTLKELKAEEPFNSFDGADFKRASKYLIWTGNHNVDISTFFMLEDLRREILSGTSNDIAKYMMPENYQTELAWSINARSLQNFLHLRTNKAALWEIRELAYKVFDSLPSDHKYLFKDYLYKEKEAQEVKLKTEGSK